MAISGYEQIREQRIKENMERMQKLGLFDLSSKLNSAISSCKKSRTFQKRTPQSSPQDSSLPPRRSSRLENKAPISYSENSDEKVTRTKGTVRQVKNCGEPWVETGSRPEIYTEEHEKLLGSSESAWSLSDDDGRRVYDQVNGKTCHQCRQKTLGHRTSCIKCNPSVQGQFCGDCLYIRYGENVLEANQNPNWICPPCRGICNCSLCRHANGWLPTGAIHRKIANLGYKSVAHYLIQTRRAETLTKSDEVEAADEAVIIKSSLSFVDTKEEDLVMMSEDAKEFAGHKEDDDLQVDDGKQVTPKPVDDEITLDSIRRRLTQSKNIKSDNFGGEKDEPTGPDNKSEVVLEVGLRAVGKKRKGGKSGVANEPNFDSIGRRLRQRHDSDNENIEDEEVIPKNQLLKEIALVNFGREALKGGGQKKIPQWMAQMNAPRFTREDREPLINLLPKQGRQTIDSLLDPSSSGSNSNTSNISRAKGSPEPLVQQPIAPPSTTNYAGLFRQHILQKVALAAGRIPLYRTRSRVTSKKCLGRVAERKKAENRVSCTILYAICISKLPSQLELCEPRTFPASCFTGFLKNWFSENLWTNVTRLRKYIEMVL